MNIGIATGKASGILALDIDRRHRGSDTLTRLEERFGPLPDTAEASTGGGGRHILFQHPDWKVKNKAAALGPGVDIRSDGGYFVSAPSAHISGRRYQWKAGRSPGEVQIAEAPTWLLEELRSAASQPGIDTGHSGQRIPEGTRDDSLASLAGTMWRRGFSLAAIEAALLAENSERCDPPLPGSQVGKIARSIAQYARVTEPNSEASTACRANDIKSELSRIPADTDKAELPDKLRPILQELAKMPKVKADAYLANHIKSRFGLKSKDIDGYRSLVNTLRKAEAPSIKTSRSSKKPAYIALFDELVDLVEDAGRPAFLVKEGNDVVILSQIEKDGVLYYPPPKESIPWLLPRGERVREFYSFYDNGPQGLIDGALFHDLVAYHKRISELPGDGHYDLLALWDLHTYVLEAVQYSPVICLCAVPERGKSRTGKGLIYVGYRGICVESLRDAFIVRMSKYYQVSILFDIRDVWRKALRTGSDDVLLLRFEKGAVVPRVVFPERGPLQDTVFYSIFGPTVISTNESVRRILETRSISITMPEATRRFENDVRPEHALELKERLLGFRAKHMGSCLPDTCKPASGRLGDILKPLRQVMRIVKPDLESEFLLLVRSLEEERLSEKSESFEAEILNAILALRDQVDKGYLSVKSITDEMNERRPERLKLSYQRIGRLLKAMGFRKGRTSRGARSVLCEDEKISRMKETYGLGETSDTPDCSETPDPGAGVTDESDDTDVSPSLF